jgi:hypothetical protein
MKKWMILLAAAFLGIATINLSKAAIRRHVIAKTPPIETIWLVASTNTANRYDTPDGDTYWFQDPLLPTVAGDYVLQDSYDMGQTWHDLSGFTLDPVNPPLVTVYVNPLIGPPYMWYRIIPQRP